MVVPYIIIASPGSRTPALAASLQASIVPIASGLPTGMSVASAPSAVTNPATSPASATRAARWDRRDRGPVTGREVAHGITLACRVMVEHVLAPKPEDGVGMCHE